MKSFTKTFLAVEVSRELPRFGVRWTGLEIGGNFVSAECLCRGCRRSQTSREGRCCETDADAGVRMRGHGFVHIFTGALANKDALTNRHPACLKGFVVGLPVNTVVRLRVRNVP